MFFINFVTSHNKTTWAHIT